MLSILGIGYSHPKNEVTNQFIVGLGVDTNEQWIMDKIGVRSRRTVLPLSYIAETKNVDPRRALEVSEETPVSLGVAAAKMALERARIPAEKVGLVICNSCFPNQIVPTTGQEIAAKLGSNARSFDALSACPAFAFLTDLVNNFCEEALPEYVLCVSSAALTQKVNYTDRTDGAIWGDGAAAWVISARHPGRLAILESSYTTDPARCDAVVVDRYGFFHQDGRAVRDFSVRQTVRLIKDLESRYPLDWNRDIFIGHQANVTMLRQITNNRGIPESNHWTNASEFGNQAGAGAAIVLGQHWDYVQTGQKIVVAVLGAGLSWGSMLLEGR